MSPKPSLQGRIEYWSHILRCIAILPLLYRDARRAKKEIPTLPEAADTTGAYGSNQAAKKVWIIGESTMSGVGVSSHHAGFAGYLTSSLSQSLATRVTYEVYARTGYNTRQLNEEIIPLLAPTPPAIIVIGIGANDAFDLSTIYRWTAELHRLLSHLRHRYPQTPMVFAQMPPIREFPAFSWSMQFALGGMVEIFGRELGRIVELYEDCYYRDEIISLATWGDRVSSVDRADFFSDGVHPSGLTYRLWAEDIASFILKNNLI